MSSDPCSRRNSELCLFGFNHCEVSAQLCKTCVTNLSKEHTEERQEAKVWWETMNSDPDSHVLCTNTTNTHPPDAMDPLLVFNHQSPLKGDNSQQQPKLSLKQRCKEWPVLTARWCGFSRRKSHYVAVCVCEWVGGSLHSSNNTDQDQVSLQEIVRSAPQKLPTGAGRLRHWWVWCLSKALPLLKPSATGYCLVMVWWLQQHIWHYRAPRKILLSFASGWAVKIPARTSLGMLGWHRPSFTTVWTVHTFPFPSMFSPPTPPKKENKKLPYLGLLYPEVNIKSSPPRLLKPMTSPPPTVNYPFSHSTFARLSCFSSFPAFPTHFTTPWDAGSCLSAWNSWESVALSFEQPPQTSLIPYINRKWRPSWGEGSESVYLPSNLLFIWVLCVYYMIRRFVKCSKVCKTLFILTLLKL